MDQLSPVRHGPAASATVIPPGAGGPPAAQWVRRVIAAGLIASIVMLALLAATQLINFGVFDLRFHALDTDYHASVFGVVSLLAEAAAAAAIWWRGSGGEPHRWAWLTLGAIVAGLVLVRTLTTFDAAALAMPLACVLCLVCWLTCRDRGAPRSVVWAGLILMVTSLVLHQVGLDADVLNYSNRTWAYQITAVAKHGSELAGWMLLATGIIAGMRNRQAPKATPPGSLVFKTESGAR